VQPVGPDDQVEPASGARGEDHVHARRILAQGRDGVAEHELGVLARGVVQHRGELGPRHLELGAVRLPDRDAADPASGGVDDGHPGHGGRDLAQAWQHPHPLGHLHRLAPDVDRVAA
jgi:hypothetical protein